MKTAVKVGDLIHSCITARGFSYVRAYRHPCSFVVVAVARDGVFCRIIKEWVIGRSVFKYRSWVRSVNNNPVSNTVSGTAQQNGPGNGIAR